MNYVKVEISDILPPVLTVTIHIYDFYANLKIFVFVLLHRIIQYLLYHTKKNYPFELNSFYIIPRSTRYPVPMISIISLFYGHFFHPTLTTFSVNYSVSCSNNPYSIRISDNLPYLIPTILLGLYLFYPVFKLFYRTYL